MNIDPPPLPPAPPTEFQRLVALSKQWQSSEAQARAIGNQKAIDYAAAKVAEVEARLEYHRRAGSKRAPLQTSTNPHLGTRPTTHLKPKGGAFFRPLLDPKLRTAVIAESANEANHIAKEKADSRTFSRWFASLSPEDQAFAREHQLNKPMPVNGFRKAQAGEDALDGAEREIIPEADIRGSRNGKPIVSVENAAIDEMEPESFSVDVENLSPKQIEAAVEDFADALRWALSVEDTAGPDDEHHLVRLGQRSAVLIGVLRQDLAGGLIVEPQLARAFLESFTDFRLSETLARLKATGAHYGRFLEWMRRAKDLGALGERLQLVAYAIRPDLIDAVTLAELGSAMNVTRQAKDKSVGCLRDTFAGLRAFAMRDDSTRLRCQQAQLAS